MIPQFDRVSVRRLVLSIRNVIEEVIIEQGIDTHWINTYLERIRSLNNEIQDFLVLDDGSDLLVVHLYFRGGDRPIVIRFLNSGFGMVCTETKGEKTNWTKEGF